MKYQCNLCAKIHDEERDANDCHPDVIKMSDEEAAEREWIGREAERLIAEVEEIMAARIRGPATRGTTLAP